MKIKIELIKNIINETKFNNYNWDTKKIRNDFNSNINTESIWLIVKNYLMQKGFETRYKNIDKKINFNEVPILSSIN
jgi:hypothetical protein